MFQKPYLFETNQSIKNHFLWTRGFYYQSSMSDYLKLQDCREAWRCRAAAERRTAVDNDYLFVAFSVPSASEPGTPHLPSSVLPLTS
jgi:hypothetical protein